MMKFPNLLCFLWTLSFVLVSMFGYAQAEVDHLERKGKYFYSISEFDSARYYLTKAIEKKPVESIDRGFLYLKLGKTYRMLEDYKKAFPFYLKAESIFKKLDDKNALLECYTDQMEFNRSLGIWETVEQNMASAEELLKKFHPKDAVLAYYLNRRAAIASEYQHDSEKTLEYSFKALKLAQKVGDKNLQASSYNQIGFEYESPGNFDKAVSYFHKALELYKQAKNERYVADLYANLAGHFQRTKDFDSSIFYGTLGYNLTKRKGFVHSQQGFCLLLFESSNALKDYKSALKYHIEYVEIGNISGQERWNKILYDLEKKHQVEAKEKELKEKQYSLRLKDMELEQSETKIVLIVSTLLIILILFSLVIFYYLRMRKANKKLNSLLVENQFLLEESNHRIKNNLQLVTSLLHRKLDSDHELSKLGTVLEEIESISTLHKHIYLSEDKRSVNLHNYLLDIQHNFTSFLQDQKVEMHFEVQAIDMEINKAMYIGLLLTELLINSLKHAFPKTKAPRIDFSIYRTQDGKMRVSFTDNGRGLSSNDHPELVELMCKQLKAEYVIEGKKGFNFEMTLKA